MSWNHSRPPTSSATRSIVKADGVAMVKGTPKAFAARARISSAPWRPANAAARSRSRVQTPRSDALLAAVMAGFGGVISEVGASIMVGGNVKGLTRVLTTATVMETGRGNFDVAIALSVILLLLTFAVNYLLTRIQQRERPR